MPLIHTPRQERRDGGLRPRYRSMTLTEDGLVLGAETILVKLSRSAGQNPELAVYAAGERILALLTVAYGRPAPPAVLGNIRRSVRHWQTGDDCLASIELALTGLPAMSDEPEARRRLHDADRLLARGMAPGDLAKALGIDPTADVVKAGFNPAEPRVLAGDGPDSGRWRDGNGVRAIPIAARKPPAGAEYKTGDPDKFFDTLYPQVHALAQRLGIDETWILGLAAHESGWLDQHNRRLNDPFGVTHAGGLNVAYGSIDDAVAYWEKKFGPVVRDATSGQDFVRRLRAAGYNQKDPRWSEKVADTILSVPSHLKSWKEKRNI